MKEIKAVIQPFMLTKVLEALEQIDGLPGLIVHRDVLGFGRVYKGDVRQKIVMGEVEYSHKVKLEIVVPDDLVDRVVLTIQTTAHTGNLGDGKIFVFPVEDVVKIRTGEHGESAF